MDYPETIEHLLDLEEVQDEAEYRADYAKAQNELGEENYVYP